MQQRSGNRCSNGARQFVLGAGFGFQLSQFPAQVLEKIDCPREGGFEFGRVVHGVASLGLARKARQY